MNLEIGKVYVMEPTDHARAVLRFASYPITSCWQNVYTGLDTRKWRYVGEEEDSKVFELVDDTSFSMVIEPHESFRFVEVKP